MCDLGTQCCNFYNPYMIIDLFPPQTVNIYKKNCPSIFLEIELLISKFRNIALHNALQSSYSRSGSHKLDWTG